MISDPGRFGAYAEAIAAAVRPGDVVAEIGAGTGVFSLLACKAGARRVFAIESESTIQFARELAAANGFSDRFEFFECNSQVAGLPERANVIISDIRGALPLFEHAIPALEDARKRMLAPGGTMIPERDILKAALMEVEAYYTRLTGPWHASVAGVDLSTVRPAVLNQPYSGTFAREQILSDEPPWAALDYMAGVSPRVAADFDLCAMRNGTAHGICLWFEAQLFKNIGFSAAPGMPDNVFGQLFLPLLQPVALQAGEKVHVAVRANLVGDDYVWQWETSAPAAPDRERLHLQQSSFRGAIYSAQSLHRQALDYVPVLSEAGQVDAWMLARMDGHTSIEQLARCAAQHFPRVFPSWQEAFRHAVDLSAKFAR